MSTEISTRQLCNFLSRYASVMLGCGATCMRIEKNVERIAARAGLEAEMFIMPRHIHVSVRRHNESHCSTELVRIWNGGVSFYINARLSRLSWDYADGLITLEQAERMLERLCNPRVLPLSGLLILVGLANASFCRIFGGDFSAMSFVFAATVIGMFLKHFLLSRGWDLRVVITICAFVSALIASGDSFTGLGSTPDISVGTSILYLVPGIPFINSFSDLLAGHYICAFGRAMSALVLTGCLSVGLCAVMFLMHLSMF